MARIFNEIRARWDWKVYLILLVLYSAGFFTGFPFVLSMQAYTPANVYVDIAWGYLFGFVTLSLGAAISTSTGLGAPYIEDRLYGKGTEKPFKRVLHLSVAVVIGGSLILMILRPVFSVLTVAFGGDLSTVASESTYFLSAYPEIWKWLLVSFHAGVTEEIIFRYGLMNLLVWVGRLALGEKGGSNSIHLWIANLLSALVFGAFHLVGVAPVPDSLYAQASVVAENTLAGLVFGWFFCRYGLESAMLTHFLLDVFFYVITLPVLMTGNFAMILGWLVVTVVVLIVSINRYNRGRLEKVGG